MAAAAGDGEMAVMERMSKKEADIKKLSIIFSDADGSGQIDYMEFQEMLDKPFVRAWLSVLELDVNDMNRAFAILDDGDGMVSFDEFIQGVLKMRGSAKGVDVFHLIAQSQKIIGQIEEMRAHFDREHHVAERV